ncbi:MAG: bacteriohemerythrin [Rhodospirillales bacterium]|nr:bacteriohemerythrin [Rhodospirillales bacterium]MDH3910648.1 bacteriohemerythrin [Rhodospirillales bacterium]MDH3918348.1 bacteriohemerythrin [Rhodospirillales bacterium]MDH3965656.1 bacteriohemerythrin [Rhodospirillales bacterium]
MPLMQWTEAMSVGLEELDDDHKVLIKVINDLAANAGDAARRDVVRQCLLSLRRYAEFHFAREEKVMSACKYPGLDSQKNEHRDFVKRIQEVTSRFDEDTTGSVEVVNEALLNFLKEWLNHHILIEDMAYRPHVERSAEAKQAAKAFKASEVWWSQ